MNNFVKAMDGLSLLVKIILALPFLDIVWVIYRIIKSASDNNTLGLVLGIVLLIVGIPFLWIVDIISIVLWNKVLWLD